MVPIDYNHDSHLDFAASDAFGPVGTVSVVRGKRGGKLAKPITFDVGDQPYGIAQGNLNGDRKVDLVVPNSQDETVSVLLGH